MPTLPALPGRVPNTNWLTPTIDGTTWTPANSAELDAAVAALATADPTKNHAIILQLGVVYSGNWTLPNRGAGTGWVYIYTQEKHDGTFAKTSSQYVAGVTETPGDRLAYKDASLYLGASCKLAQLENAGAANTPLFRFAAGAHHYWFEALEEALGAGVATAIEGGFIDTTGVVNNSLGVPTALADVPHHINVGHCIFRGDPAKQCRRGIYMNGSWVGVRDSSAWYIWEDGADSQCFGWWQSPGAIGIFNCFGESGGENILGGGAGPDILDRPLPEDFMKDITIWNCHFTKDPTRSGIVKKNLIEFKDGSRIVIKRCIVEHNTGEAQPGNSMPFVLINQDDLPDLPHDTADITIDTVLVYGGGSMFVLSGWQKQGQYDPVLRLRRVHVKNVYGKNICGTLPEAAGTTQNYISIFNNAQDLTLEHITAEAVGAGIVFDRPGTDPAATNLEIRDCLFGKGFYGSLWSSVGEGNAALAAEVVNPDVHNNVFYAPDGVPDNAANYPAGNFYVTKDAVGFAAWQAQNPGALAVSSPYHNAATDGTDIGADLAAIAAMEANVRETILPWSAGQTLSALQLTPVGAGIQTGQQQSLFTITALDQSNASMPVPAGLTIQSTNPSIATVVQSGASLVVTGLSVGTTQLTVSSGAVTSAAVTLTVSSPVTPSPTLTSLVLGPSAISGIANGAVDNIIVGAFDQNGASMAIPALTFNTTNRAVAAIVQISGNVLRVEAYEAGIAHVWVNAGAVVSNRVTVLVSDPAGGKGHFGKGRT